MLEMVEPSNLRDRMPHQSARAFQEVLQEVFGIPFTLFDAVTGLKVVPGGSVHDRPALPGPDPAAVVQLAASGQPLVVPCEPNAFRVSLVLHSGGAAALVAVGFFPALSDSARARALEHKRLQGWARDFSERLRLRDLLATRTKGDEELHGQLTGAWEVNLTLGECMQRLRFNRHALRDRQRILQSALQLLHAEALLWTRLQPGCAPLIAGELPITAEEALALAEHLSRAPDAQGPEPYLCNNLRATPWGPSFPAVHSLLAFNLSGHGTSAWLIALNKQGKAGSQPGGALPAPAPFRNSDAAVLSPFASMMDMHARAAGKFEELRSLLVGLARCLTAAIDAKDAYTAGHSERVARLAVEIGRELHLPDDQLSDTYLAGLLHDVGKIGVRESVLCKPGPLTPEEFEHMKQHVTIGYQILQDLGPMRHLLPGVLHHHERFDGKGYPSGLAGEKIPFLARLLAVADGFDAMSSDRPYRAPMSPARVLSELKTGAGTHWDPQIIAAALRCTNRLVAIRQRGLGESLCQAVDAALRTGDSSTLRRTGNISALEEGPFR
jgi:HD-GYP domain-containing protein (c-di-GMP phosphodiesterase class II)